jgi:hypothetical protein
MTFRVSTTQILGGGPSQQQSTSQQQLCALTHALFAERGANVLGDRGWCL